MTLSEFKAWFDGYTEDMKDAPSKKQWERIKARVSEIDGSPITPIVCGNYALVGKERTAAGLCHPSEAASVLGADDPSSMAGPIIQEPVDRFPAKAAAQYNGGLSRWSPS